MTDKFDAPLLGILQSCGELEPFLEVILGFLYRKTDFFLPLSVDQTMGFSPGAAQAKLLKVFKKFEKLREMSMTRESPKSPPQQQKPLTPPVTPGTTSASNVSSATATAVSSAPATVSSASSVPASASTSSFSTVVATPPVSSAPAVASPALASLPGPPKEEKIEEIQGDWSTSNWDHHNGGFTEKYAWSQTAQDVDLKMALPSPNVTASQLKIDIKAHSLNVQLKTEEGLRSVLEEKLHSIIKPEESMWSLHKGEYIQVNLEKGRDGYWWTAMFEDGHQVPLDSIDTTRKMTEFGQEEQATVQKLMFDQHQKMKGKPTSDELATEDILKSAWNAEGSPFKGTEYDRSKINLSNSMKPPLGFTP